jgi:hypothetical protein
MPTVRTSRLAKIVFAHADTNASTTPDPVPTSRTSGIGLLRENLSDRKEVSHELDRVSISRKESSAGSYTLSKLTWLVEGVGSIPTVDAVLDAQKRSDKPKFVETDGTNHVATFPFQA